MKTVRGKEGGVLIMVMVVMLAMSALAVGLHRLHETDALEAVYVKHSAEAFWVAEAGLQQTLSRLRTDTAFRKFVSSDPDNPDTATETVGAGRYEVEVWGDGLGNNFSIRSRGTVRDSERLLLLSVVLNEFGPHGLITLDGDSRIRDGANIDGSIYQNGELTTRGDVDITGDVLAENYTDFDPGYPIPEDGYIDISIDTDYFSPYLSAASTGATIVTNTLDLAGGLVVVNSSINPERIISSGGAGVLVVKGNQTFSKDFEVGSYVTIIVDGDLSIQKNAGFGDNVTMFSTGEMDLFKNATADVITGTGCAFLALDDVKIKKELEFDGIIFTEGELVADKDLQVSGTIVTKDGFDIKKDATVTFDESVIPQKVREDMVSLNFIVAQSFWDELPLD